jgi:hypothetical protein
MNENTMNRMKHLFCVLLLAALGSFSFKANAYTERNMLQKAADETTLKNVLVMKQAWVPYPAYTDRAAWDSLMGPNKQRLIEAGENDTRVHPLHARKMAARLQAETAGDPAKNPILLWVDFDSGHGAGKSFDMRVRDTSDLLLFFARNLGLSFADKNPAKS